jgi:death-on-curing family protein
MDSEYILTKDEIRAINEMYGGSLRSDAEIETALTLGKGNGICRKIAYLWRSILVGHPFTDGNKRTALVVGLRIASDSGVDMDEKRKETMVSEITRIARENITDLNNIERVVRYALTGD